MKKFLLVFLLFVLVIPPAFCEEQGVFLDNTNKVYQRQLMETGFKILNANQINRRIVFKISSSKLVNAFASALDHSVTVYKGIFAYIENTDELAFIISHEIAHNIDYYSGYGRRMAMEYCKRSYETKADLIGIDLMVKAGYNPLGAITISQKIMGEDFWAEAFCTHPKGSKRTAQQYVYIKRKYPQFLSDPTYAKNQYYQNFLLTSQDSIAQIEEKWQIDKKPKDYIPVTDVKYCKNKL